MKLFDIDIKKCTMSFTSWKKKHRYKLHEGRFKSMTHPLKVIHTIDGDYKWHFWHCEACNETFLRSANRVKP